MFINIATLCFIGTLHVNQTEYDKYFYDPLKDELIDEDIYRTIYSADFNKSWRAKFRNGSIIDILYQDVKVDFSIQYELEKPCVILTIEQDIERTWQQKSNGETYFHGELFRERILTGLKDSRYDEYINAKSSNIRMDSPESGRSMDNIFSHCFEKYGVMNKRPGSPDMCENMDYIDDNETNIICHTNNSQVKNCEEYEAQLLEAREWKRNKTVKVREKLSDFLKLKLGSKAVGYTDSERMLILTPDIYKEYSHESFDVIVTRCKDEICVYGERLNESNKLLANKREKDLTTCREGLSTCEKEVIKEYNKLVLCQTEKELHKNSSNDCLEELVDYKIRLSKVDIAYRELKENASEIYRNYTQNREELDDERMRLKDCIQNLEEEFERCQGLSEQLETSLTNNSSIDELKREKEECERKTDRVYDALFAYSNELANCSVLVERMRNETGDLNKEISRCGMERTKFKEDVIEQASQVAVLRDLLENEKVRRRAVEQEVKDLERAIGQLNNNSMINGSIDSREEKGDNKNGTLENCEPKEGIEIKERKGNFFEQLSYVWKSKLGKISITFNTVGIILGLISCIGSINYCIRCRREYL